MMKKQIPPPIDTSNITVNPSLLNLQEELAKNTHAVWAAERIAEGWTLGPARNEERKETPCLVPYDDLPENEKEYDRRISMEVLKTILQFGYEICDPAKQEVEDPAGDLDHIKKHLTSGSCVTLAHYRNVWWQKDVLLWDQNPELYLLLGEQILKTGEPLFAFDVFSKGLGNFDDFASLEQLKKEERDIYINLCQKQALALAQSGAAVDAGILLSKLIDLGVNDAETKGLLGRTYKDMSLQNTGKVRRDKNKAAFAIYHRAFQEAKGNNDDDASYYNGINAATLAFLGDDRQRAEHIAIEVERICQREVKRLSADNCEIPFWLDATLGEVALLAGDFELATDYYTRAAEKTAGDFRSLGSMLKQVKLILRKAGQVETLLDDCFQLPAVCIFSSLESEPLADETLLRAFFQEQLETNRGRIAYSSGISHAEIVFLEEVLRQGGEINIVLPVDKKNIIEHCFAAGDSELEERFMELCEQAATIRALDQYHEGKFAHSLKFCLLYIQGTAMARVEQMETRLLDLSKHSALEALVESGEVDRENGTLSHTISLEGVNHSLFLPMLFADVKGYSKLTERELVNFATVFLAKVARITDKYGSNLLSKQTIGDGLFIVFKNLTTAVHFAIDLQVMVAYEKWEEHGLPDDLTIRISLDAGPCYTFSDPVEKQRGFCGNYVIRAARMEPITPPGHIYASDTFVALCRVTNVEGIHFDYAGSVSLPKNYGVIPAYHVRPAQP